MRLMFTLLISYYLQSGVEFCNLAFLTMQFNNYNIYIFIYIYIRR